MVVINERSKNGITYYIRDNEVTVIKKKSNDERICQMNDLNGFEDHLLVIINVVNIVNLFIITLKMNN